MPFNKTCHSKRMKAPILLDEAKGVDQPCKIILWNFIPEVSVH
jgi:hypothetical protein